ncbi:hypothetical protein TTHERM_00318870 (macronuclear) [Tetrahymena thermophila SB210]|uniref:Uncharacterized protein n=1 Tax=Tetrahymena thermophila (strain SB210) TaxID=312017 RepID=I7MG85_TETTS|nr:hypothetical protein TTHERM_00318870 [Tetrahymena thermophila SB210]EAS01224.2 hypothetical protein TTHERM_00318870 [Tetrahymena thermophila SB210]|eukprot:XP_001021469.2 hypothetical protein TTHERM_00318870 [Tetrahymena thermophila SB210]
MYNLYQHYNNNPKLNNQNDNRRALKVQYSLDFQNKHSQDQEYATYSQSLQNEKDSKFNFQKVQLNQNMDIELNIKPNQISHHLKRQYYERYKHLQNTKKEIQQKQEMENNILQKTEQAILSSKGQLNLSYMQNHQNDQNKIFSRGNLVKQIYQNQVNQSFNCIQNDQNEIKENKRRYIKDAQNNIKKDKNIEKNANNIETPQNLLKIEILNENKEMKKQQLKIEQQDKQIYKQFECDALERKCMTEFDERKKQKVLTDLGEKNGQYYQRNTLNLDEFKENIKEANSTYLLNNSNKFVSGRMINNFCNDSDSKNQGSQINNKNKSSDKPIKFVQQHYQKYKRPPVVFKQKRNEQNQSLERNKCNFQLNNSDCQIDKQIKNYSKNQRLLNQIDLKKITQQKPNFELKSLDFQVDLCQQSYRSIPTSDLSARESKIKDQILNKTRSNKYGLKKEQIISNNIQNFTKENSNEQNINNFLSIQFPNKTFSNATNDQNEDSLLLACRDKNQSIQSQNMLSMYNQGIRNYLNFESIQNMYNNGQITPIYVKPGSAKQKNASSRKSSKVRFAQEFKEGRIRSLTEQSQSKDDRVSINKILMDSFFGKKPANLLENIVINTQQNSALSNQYIHDDIQLENSENKNREEEQFKFIQRNILVKSFNEL